MERRLFLSFFHSLRFKIGKHPLGKEKGGRDEGVSRLVEDKGRGKILFEHATLLSESVLSPQNCSEINPLTVLTSCSEINPLQF